MAAHKENMEKSGENSLDEKDREKSVKFMKNSHGTVRENEIVLANISKNVDIAHFISILCQRIRVVSVMFCYTCTANLFESGENIYSQGKVREN